MKGFDVRERYVYRPRVLRMEFDGTRYTVTNMRDYELAVPHPVSVEPEFVQVWDDPTDVWNFGQINVVVEPDEVLLLESNETIGHGTHVAIPRTIVRELVDNSVLEPAD